MSLTSMRRQLDRLEAHLAARASDPGAILERFQADSGLALSTAGYPPDPWQQQVIASDAQRVLLLCSRQAGKSTTAAALALRAGLLKPNQLVLLLSPTLRQSGELFRKMRAQFHALGRPVRVRRITALQMEWVNGSRVVSLPGTEATIRGYSDVSLIVIDEAARVADPLYLSVRPMLAVSQGRLLALSTPFGRRGWFHDAWHGPDAWDRVRITAAQCPRISAEFLAEERRAMGERWFRQEYECSFEETTDSVFSHADIQAAMSCDVPPLFPEP